MRNMNSRLSFMGARSDKSAIQAARVRVSRLATVATGPARRSSGTVRLSTRCLPVPCGPARSCPHESNQAPSAEAYRPAEYPTLRVASRACGPRAFGCLDGRASRGGRESRNPSATYQSQRNGASVCAGGPWGSSWKVEPGARRRAWPCHTPALGKRIAGALEGHSSAARPTRQPLKGAAMLGAGATMTILVAFMLSGLKILREYERAVVFRLGRVVGARGPGIIYVIPGIEKAIRIDLRTITMDIPSQDVITKDNVSLKVSAVLYFRVLDPNRAVVAVENYLFATSQNAQTTLRSVCGEAELDQLLAEREKINAHLQSIIDQHTEPWGIKVVQVAIKFIDLPEEMRRVMAHQAEAERERRAKVIAAEGEYQAAQRLADAAAIMAKEPIALQLRFLQTLVEVAAENNSTTIFPVPIDILKPFFESKGDRTA